MAVIKLEPAYKDYLWGGDKLKTFYNKVSDLDIVAESWEVSSHPDGQSIVGSGPLRGQTLSEYVDARGRDILGTRGKSFEFFPILIKFIDAKQDLSIQVHPSDAYALKHEGQYGKTEMWCILEAEKDSCIYYGTNREITKEAYREAIENNSVLEILNKVPVNRGDVIFVEAGTIHAIGAGIVICEIQQNSNITYRVYDFNRKDAQGNTRQLHIDKAVEVSTLTPLDTTFKPQGIKQVHEEYSETILVEHSLFKTEEIILDGTMTLDVDHESFIAIICIEGIIRMIHDNTTLTLCKGESAFIESNTADIVISGEGTFLRVSV